MVVDLQLLRADADRLHAAVVAAQLNHDRLSRFYDWDSFTVAVARCAVRVAEEREAAALNRYYTAAVADVAMRRVFIPTGHQLAAGPA